MADENQAGEGVSIEVPEAPVRKAKAPKAEKPAVNEEVLKPAKPKQRKNKRAVFKSFLPKG